MFGQKYVLTKICENTNLITPRNFEAVNRNNTPWWQGHLGPHFSPVRYAELLRPVIRSCDDLAQNLTNNGRPNKTTILLWFRPCMFVLFCFFCNAEIYLLGFFYQLLLEYLVRVPFKLMHGSCYSKNKSCDISSDTNIS